MPHIRHIYYEEAGEGRPVILLPCPALSHLYWKPLMELLQPYCHCIAMDVRGHGGSGLGEAPWTFADIAADIGVLVRRLGLSPAPVLVGYSAAGGICLQAALDEPDLYAGLVLIGGFSECSSLYLQSKILLGMTAVRLGLAKQVGRSVVSTNHVSPEHAAAMRVDAERVNPRALFTFYREARRANYTARLEAIRQPVLLIYGRDDEVIHPYYRIMSERLPNARAAFVAGADHRVPTRKPLQTARNLADFLDAL